jgi:acetyl esterase/lipase
MKRLLLLLIFCITITHLYAQTNIIKLWPGQVPGETDAKHPAVLRDSLQHITRITDITDPLLTIYRPSASLNLHVAIIVSPGGGNKYLAVDLEGYEIAQWLSKLGYTAFVLNYRVPNKQAGSLQDIERAISLVRSKAKDYNVSINKVGVMGFSAGGNLSARAMTNFNNRTYQAVDKNDSLSCRPDFALLIYPGSLSIGNDHKLIPEVPVTKNTPPTFIFVAADDQYGPPLSLAYALRDNKIPYELHIYPKGGHGYGLRKGNPAAETWPALALKWLYDYIVDK